MMSDSLFSDAGWFFFAIWSIAVGIVNITAFGRDLVPSKAPSTSRNTSTTRIHDGNSGDR
ncbi:MAG: hypothetical protein LAP86_27090 [Acidobacteriia bacterium]|nr:hypothetical protein [Terriglobia bacterium]